MPTFQRERIEKSGARYVGGCVWGGCVWDGCVITSSIFRFDIKKKLCRCVSIFSIWYERLGLRVHQGSEFFRDRGGDKEIALFSLRKVSDVRIVLYTHTHTHLFGKSRAHRKQVRGNLPQPHRGLIGPNLTLRPWIGRNFKALDPCRV